MPSTQEVHGRSQCGYRQETLHVHFHMETWRHFTKIRRHLETHRDTSDMETHGDTWRHTPYKICSQIKTDIYDAISLLALIGPMRIR